MSYALTRLTGNGSTQVFTIGFNYRDKADVVVKVDGVTKSLTTDYTFQSDSQIRFNSAPANNAAIVIRRATSQNTRLVDYAAGAVFKESDLDTDSTQGFFMAQESIDIANDSITKNDSNQYDAENIRLINLATPVASTDAANKAYVQSFADSYNSRYYGESATAPTDPAPSEGDLWWDSTNNMMKVHNGTGWQDASSRIALTSNREVYTVGTSSGSYTGSTTSFPATYDAGFVDVFLNGSKLIHGTDFTATNGTTIVLTNAASSGDKVDIVATGAAVLTETNFLPLSGGTVTGLTNFTEGAHIYNNKMLAFNGSQLVMGTTGTESFIIEGGTGDLSIDAANLNLRASPTVNYITATNGGAVSLYHNNSVKLATTNTGISVTGTLSATGYNDTNWNTAYGWGDHSQAGYLTAMPSSYNNSNWDTAYGWGNHASAGYLTAMPSSYNNSNWDTAYNNHITGVSYSGSTLTLTQQDGGTITTTINTSGGGGGGGGGTATGVDLADNVIATFGDGNDLQIYHDGSNSRIVDSGTGYLKIQATDRVAIRSADDSERMADFYANADVRLYYDNAQKLATTSTGIDVTGAINGDSFNISDGTETTSIPSTADRISFTGASFNYIQTSTHLQVQPQGDLVLFGTGSEIMRLKSGRVGIGTTSPDGQLDVRGAGLSDVVVRATSTDSTSRVLLQNDAKAFGLRINGDDKFRIKDETADVDRLLIDSSGNVGIGTTSPIAKLTVDGQIRASGSLGYTFNSPGDTDGGMFSPSDGVIVFKSNGSERLRIDSSGNVGIGTSSPAFQFHLYNSITGAAQVEGGSRADIFLVDSGSATDQKRQTLRSNDGNFIIGTENDARTAFTEKMRIDSSGNVGIGTTSPTRALDVSKSGSTILANFKNTGGTTSFITLGNTTSTADQIRVGSNGTALTLSTNYAERMRIDSLGNVLVGKTSDSINTVGGQLNADGLLVATRDGGNTAVFNRKTSNGDIVQFRKDNTIIGSIGADSNSQLMIGSGDTGLSFQSNNDAIIPRNTNGSARTQLINLGTTGAQFKDIHLSGVVNAGDGSASAPSYTFGDDTHTGMFSPSNDIIAFTEGGVERMRLNTSGQLLVGTTSGGTMGSKIIANGLIQGSGVRATSNSSRFYEAGNYGGASIIMYGYSNSTTSTMKMISFRNLSSTEKGSIAVLGSSTLYNTSSDERLKENIQDAGDAGSKIDAIRIRQFDWKEGGEHQDYGVIAQELQSVAPEAVTEGYNEEEMWSVDYSKLVPTLIKEIQSLRNRVAELENN